MKQNVYLTVKHKIFQASLTLIMRRKAYWYLMIHLILVSCDGSASSIIRESFSGYIEDLYSAGQIETCINGKQLNLFSTIPDSIKSPQLQVGYCASEYTKPTGAYFKEVSPCSAACISSKTINVSSGTICIRA